MTLPTALYQHYPTRVDPLLLGFECHSVLRDRWGNYDYYGFLEDDLVLQDPWFFEKLRWFNSCLGPDKLLQPNRFERGRDPRNLKVYVDGDLKPELTAHLGPKEAEPVLRSSVMGVSAQFQRPLNPHSGCFFLNHEQLQRWIHQPYFLDRDTSFVGPLESAATLGVARCFAIYKPANANAGFLEIEHHGEGFLSKIRYVSGA